MCHIIIYVLFALEMKNIVIHFLFMSIYNLLVKENKEKVFSV